MLNKTKILQLVALIYFDKLEEEVELVPIDFSESTTGEAKWKVEVVICSFRNSLIGYEIFSIYCLGILVLRNLR